MKRRSFLKGAALASVAAAVAPVLPACKRVLPADTADADAVSARFRFGADGRFTVLQFTDTHYIAGDARSERALRCVEEALDAVRPDLVIHTGDVLFGRPDVASALEILRPIAERGIPFAVALGNHDSQFGSSREEVFAQIRALPGCVNTAPKEGVYGWSNDVLTLEGPGGVERVFYLFDTMDAVILKGEEEIHCYDYLRHSQLGWYRRWSASFAAEAGHPVPSLAFMHIPPCEVAEGLAAPDHKLVGNNCEPPCPSRLNSGLVAQLREMQDVEAVVTGHDHDCDYVLSYGQLFYIYGRYSGCDTVYNHLGLNGMSDQKVSGCRVFEFRSGEPGFRTWVRLLGGTVQQPLLLQSHQIIQL
ncbi:MAG: metallophosphoesterase family protein [Bacteroidales bacterium]|nr:metallophosphoesterase family protein [Bacteroidales bacterium]